VLVDRSGVSNRPGFVHLAAQQWRNASRERLELGLLYIRLAKIDDVGGHGKPNDAARRLLASWLQAECR